MTDRGLTSAVETELGKRHVQPAFLVDLDFDSGPVRLWTGYGDLVYDGNTFTGAGDLLDIKPAKETLDIQANGASVSLSGIPSANISLALQEPFQGRDATIMMATLDSSGAIINDPITVFKGRMDVPQINEEGDTSTIRISLESHLIDLNRPRKSRYTDQDQKSKYPDDKGLEYIAGLQDKRIIWGPFELD